MGNMKFKLIWDTTTPGCPCVGFKKEEIEPKVKTIKSYRNRRFVKAINHAMDDIIKQVSDDKIPTSM